MQDITDADFEDQVLKQDGPVLVDFWAPWCPPCLALQPILEELAPLRPDVRIVKVNVEDCPQVASLLGIKGIPMLVLFRQGRIADQARGVWPRDTLSMWLDAALTRTPEMWKTPEEFAAAELATDRALEKTLVQSMEQAEAVQEKILRGLSLFFNTAALAGGILLSLTSVSAAAAPLGLTCAALSAFGIYKGPERNAPKFTLEEMGRLHETADGRQRLRQTYFLAAQRMGWSTITAATGVSLFNAVSLATSTPAAAAVGILAGINALAGTCDLVLNGFALAGLILAQKGSGDGNGNDQSQGPRPV